MNKITLIGNSCQDCELSQTQAGKSYTRINLAVSRTFDRDKTDFFNCCVFGKTAEIASKYVKKGTKVAVSGRIEFYEDKDGKRHHSVLVDELDFMSKPKQDFDNMQQVKEAEDLPF